MPFSLFVLALYVFLKEAPVMGWFAVDPKLQAIIGIFFALVVVVDAVFWVRSGRPNWFNRNTTA